MSAHISPEMYQKWLSEAGLHGITTRLIQPGGLSLNFFKNGDEVLASGLKKRLEAIQEQHFP